MSKNPVTVTPDDTLAHVQNIFIEKGFHHILVGQGDKLVGVLSDRDLFKALSPNIGSAVETFRDAQTLEIKVSEIMSTQLVTLRPENTINDAIELFNCHKVSCIPIVDAENSIVGIVSWRDIMRVLEFLHKKGQQKAG